MKTSLTILTLSLVTTSLALAAPRRRQATPPPAPKAFMGFQTCVPTDPENLAEGLPQQVVIYFDAAQASADHVGIPVFATNTPGGLVSIEYVISEPNEADKFIRMAEEVKLQLGNGVAAFTAKNSGIELAADGTIKNSAGTTGAYTCE